MSGLRGLRAWFIPVLALAVAPAWPAAPAPAAPTTNESVRQDVLATDDTRIRVRESGDVRALAAIYADDYVLVTAEGELRTKQDQLSELGGGQLHFPKIETLERTVRVYDTTAIVLSRERASIVRNEQQIGGDLRVDRVYARRDGRWQLVLTHATRITGK